MGFFLYLHCVTANAQDDHACDQMGPGSTAPIQIVLVPGPSLLAAFVPRQAMCCKLDWFGWHFYCCPAQRRGGVLSRDIWNTTRLDQHIDEEDTFVPWWRLRQFQD